MGTFGEKLGEGEETAVPAGEAIELEAAQRFTEAEVEARLSHVRDEAAASVAEVMEVSRGLRGRIQKLSREKANLGKKLERALNRIAELERGATVVRGGSAGLGSVARDGDVYAGAGALLARDVVVGELYSAAGLLKAKPRDVVVCVDDENLELLQRMVESAGCGQVVLSPGQYVKGRVMYREREAYFSVVGGAEKECLVAAGNLLSFARGRLFRQKS